MATNRRRYNHVRGDSRPYKCDDSANSIHIEVKSRCSICRKRDRNALH